MRKICMLSGTKTNVDKNRRRTNVQQLTCNIDLFSYFFISFLLFCLIELKKPFVLNGESPAGKILKKCEKSAKKV